MWVLVAIVLGSIIALSTPAAVAQLAPLLQPAFAITMFSVGLMVSSNDVREALKAPARPLIGVLTQYTVMPLLAYGISLCFEDPTLRVGILLVGCVPGAMASNVMTLLFQGDLVLSVSMTTLATLLCPLVLSFWLPLLADTRVDVDLAALVWNATWMVVLPVLVGIAIGWRRPIAPRLRSWLPLVAASSIVLVVLVVVAKNSRDLKQMAFGVSAAMLALNLGGYGVAWLLGHLFRWPGAARRALTIEVGMQNAGLGSVLASSHLAAGGAVPSALYTALCVLTAAAALPWAHRETARKPSPCRLAGE